jgi:hypothetical protein
MTIHYHGLPLTPHAVFETSMRGRFVCVSFMDARQTVAAHRICQGVMLDNGAFSVWTRGAKFDMEGFWKWASPWLDCPTTWAVLPDSIEGDYHATKALIALAPKFPVHKVAPVWHLHDPFDWLRELTDTYPLICFGSSAEYAQVGSPAWHGRISDAFDHLQAWGAKHTNIHMLRGLQTVKWKKYPFYSVDSSDVARHHHAAKNGTDKAKAMAERWDGMQCPVRWPNDGVVDAWEPEPETPEPFKLRFFR